VDPDPYTGLDSDSIGSLDPITETLVIITEPCYCYSMRLQSIRLAFLESIFLTLPMSSIWCPLISQHSGPAERMEKLYYLYNRDKIMSSQRRAMNTVREFKNQTWKKPLNISEKRSFITDNILFM
jgi:hypothetical protein